MFAALPAYATTTVTGHIQNLSGGVVSSGTFVRFWLRGCGGNQPTVNGVAVIAPSSGGVYYFDFVPDATGLISGTLYSTRDSTGNNGGDISCGGSTTSVWYGMQIWVNGKSGPEVPVAAKNGTALDITSVTPLSSNPVVTAPTGDGTYFRLDGGNGGLTNGDCVQASAGGSLSTIASSCLTPPATAGGIQYVTSDGNDANSGTFPDAAHAKATVAAAITAVEAVGGGTVDARGLKTATITSEIDVGDGTHSVTLILPSSGTWTASTISDGTSCFLKVWAGSSIVNFAPSNGGSKFTIQDSGTVNADSMICTQPLTYTRIDAGILLYNPGPTFGTYVNGLFDWNEPVDASVVRGLTTANYNGIGFNANQPCCSAIAEKIVTNGNGQTGARPFVLSTGSAQATGPVTFLGLSADHAGAGQSEISVVNTTGNLFTANFYGSYVEGNSTAATAPHVDVNTVGGTVNFNGLAVYSRNSSETAYGAQIENNPSTTVNFQGYNYYGTETTRPILNDLSSSKTVTSTTSNNSLDYPSALSGMTAGQVPIAATPSTVTSSKTIQGTDANLLSSGTVSGTAASLCTDANGGATTTGCPSYPAVVQFTNTNLASNVSCSATTVCSVQAVTLSALPSACATNGCRIEVIYSYLIYGGTFGTLWVDDGTNTGGIGYFDTNTNFSGASASYISRSQYSSGATPTITIKGNDGGAYTVCSTMGTGGGTCGTAPTSTPTITGGVQIKVFLSAN